VLPGLHKIKVQVKNTCTGLERPCMF